MLELSDRTDRNHRSSGDRAARSPCARLVRFKPSDHGRSRQDHEARKPHPDAPVAPLGWIAEPENARRLRDGIHNVKEALLEGIRIRQDTEVREASDDEDSTSGAKLSDEITEAAITPDDAAEVPDRQESDEESASAGLFERSQTQDEVQAEIRRQRAIEEAEAAAEEEQAKIVVDDRQASFF